MASYNEFYGDKPVVTLDPETKAMADKFIGDMIKRQVIMVSIQITLMLALGYFIYKLK